MHIILLGNSSSGKDSVARHLGFINRKFAQFAKDWVDFIYGGNFEGDRHFPITEDGKTKNDLLIALHNLFSEFDPLASVRYASRSWDFPEKMNFCYTDVRRVSELLFLVENCRFLKVVYLTGGSPKSSDSELPDLISLVRVLGLPLLEVSSFDTDTIQNFVHQPFEDHHYDQIS